MKNLTFKTRSQVALEYGIDVKTLMKRLKDLEIFLPPGRISPKDLFLIYEKLGTPYAATA